jgi:hypothetical protein
MSTVALSGRRTPMARLVKVELRKMGDTRAGFWLLVVMALATLALGITFLFAADDDELTLSEFYRLLQAGPSVLLPVMAILLVTSEWSQRTALTTFTLVPNRWRVMTAKAGAIGVVLVATLLVTLVLALIFTALGGQDGAFDLTGYTVVEVAVSDLAGFAGGFAFGLLLQRSAPAIVFYFLAPTVLSIVTEVIGSSASDVLAWVDLGQATVPLSEGDVSGKEWARALTSMAVWIGIPLSIGLWRLPRTEVKSD